MLELENGNFAVAEADLLVRDRAEAERPSRDEQPGDDGVRSHGAQLHLARKLMQL